MPDTSTGRLLGNTLVQAIDAYFQARERLIRALIAGDEVTALAANTESFEALKTWMALLVNRLDERSAQQLVELWKHVHNLEALMRVDPVSPAPEDDGHDFQGQL